MFEDPKLVRDFDVPKIVGKPPKMDGENNEKPYEPMDDLGFSHYFWKHPFGFHQCVVC